MVTRHTRYLPPNDMLFTFILKVHEKDLIKYILSPNAPAIQCVITNANLIQVLQNDCMSFSKKKFIGHLIKTSHFTYLTISFKIVHRLPQVA